MLHSGKSVVDRLCRYERLAEELAFLSERSGLGQAA